MFQNGDNRTAFSVQLNSLFEHQQHYTLKVLELALAVHPAEEKGTHSCNGASLT